MRASALPLSPTHPHDDHELDLPSLSNRFHTNLSSGLTGAEAAFRIDRDGRNLLPTDLSTGHGAIHELVAVLREGGWLHTRAENLVAGDVLTLKAGQVVPADIRIVEGELTVDDTALTGCRKDRRVIRTAVNFSMFDDGATDNHLPYMQAPNIVFYGSSIVAGQAKGLVLRTGASTVLGVISAAVSTKENSDEELKKANELELSDARLIDEIKQFGVSLKNDYIPAAMKKVDVFVIEDHSLIKRTVSTVSFGTNLPAIVRSENPFEKTTEEEEEDIAAQMTSKYQENENANSFVRALTACRQKYFEEYQNEDYDTLWSKKAILRFCNNFGSNNNPMSPREFKKYAGRKNRTHVSSNSHCGYISGCEVYVHFDQECQAHVVLLHGPALEILSRCGFIKKDNTSTTVVNNNSINDSENSRNSKIVYQDNKLETSDIRNIEQMINTLEQQKSEQVIGFAELYLDSLKYPIDFNFDLKSLNFPTSNMCYLGCLGLSEKPQPELINMITHAYEADVRLVLMTDEKQSHELNSVVDVQIKDSHTDQLHDIAINLVAKGRLSVSNTLQEWQSILLSRKCIILQECRPSDVDLVVETLQDLGEIVALLASGNANALAVKNANVGLALPTELAIDLCEEAADIVLGYSNSPRCDAIRLVELVKRTTVWQEIIHEQEEENGKAEHSNLMVASFKHLMENVIETAKAAGVKQTDVVEMLQSIVEKEKLQQSNVQMTSLMGNMFKSFHLMSSNQEE